MLQLKAELGAAATTAVIVDDAVLATPLQARRHTFLATLDPAIDGSCEGRDQAAQVSEG